MNQIYSGVRGSRKDREGRPPGRLTGPLQEGDDRGPSLRRKGYSRSTLGLPGGWLLNSRGRQGLWCWNGPWFTYGNVVLKRDNSMTTPNSTEKILVAATFDRVVRQKLNAILTISDVMKVPTI